MNTNWQEWRWQTFAVALVLLLVLLGAALVLASYTSAPAVEQGVATTTDNGTATGGSGVRGAVMLGPTCPVERLPPDPQCADKPYSTLVAIFKKSDPVHAVALLRSAADGSYSAALAPGEYSVGAGESNLPRCAQVEVTVSAGAYATADISCDTGIR